MAKDFELLQYDVRAIANWVFNNFLYFNTQKCKQMLVSHMRFPPYTHKHRRKRVELVSEYKYLGVWITDDLSWSKHIDKLVLYIDVFASTAPLTLLVHNSPT